MAFDGVERHERNRRTGTLRLVTNNGITQTIVLSQALLVNNAWQHVAATFDGDSQTGVVRLYIDGVLDTTVGNALTPIPSTQPLAFCREGNYSGGTIDGIIDEVRLWNVARSTSDKPVDCLNANSGISI